MNTQRLKAEPEFPGVITIAHRARRGVDRAPEPQGKCRRMGHGKLWNEGKYRAARRQVEAPEWRVIREYLNGTCWQIGRIKMPLAGDFQPEVVGPQPRSKMRISISVGLTTRRNSTLV